MTDSQSMLTLRNIGPATARLLLEAGITDKQQLERLGANKAYRLLLTQGHEPNLNLYYRLTGAIENLDWHVVAEREQRIAEEPQVDCDT